MDITIPITIKTYDSAKELFGGSPIAATEQAITLHIDENLKKELINLLKA